MKKIAIIGAGLSGLTCARELGVEYDVTVFDKSRSVAGRMSTRYAGAFEFDHGAQYFTARHPDFQSCILDEIAKGHVAPWQGQELGRNAYLKNGILEADTGTQRFVAVPRMNSWMKNWADGLNVKLGVRITALKRVDGQWSLTGVQDHTSQDPNPQKHSYEGYDEIVLAIPAPQVLALLPDGFAEIDAVQDAHMDACFALMLGFKRPLRDMGWDTLRVNNSPIAWVAMNSSKPEREGRAAMVVHADGAWSNENAEVDRDKVRDSLLKETFRITGVEASNIIHQDLHRWLYASVSSAPHQACLRDEDKSLTVCGDWCLGGRVENAYLSGLAAARAIGQT